MKKWAVVEINNQIQLEKGTQHYIIPESNIQEMLIFSESLKELGITRKMTVGCLLRLYRFKNDLSVNELAKIISVSRQALTAIESEKTQPNSKTIKQIESLIGKDLIEYFMNE